MPTSILFGALTTTAVVAAGLAGVSPATAAPVAGGRPEAVIVILRDQHGEVPATPAQIGRRKVVVARDQTSIGQRVAGLGGRTTHTYATLNAVAATVPAGAVAALTADPAVAAVVPDLP